MGTRRGSGRTETAVDESRKETADRVARYRTNYVGRTYISMLLVPQTAAAASKVFLLSFGFPVLPFRPWSFSVFSCCCSALPATSPGEHDTSSFIYFILFVVCCHLFLCPFCFSLCQRIWIASICMSHLPYPVRRHVIPFSTLLPTLLILCTRSISVSWFYDHGACISLGGRTGTDTGCAGCRGVERGV